MGIVRARARARRTQLRRDKSQSDSDGQGKQRKKKTAGFREKREARALAAAARPWTRREKKTHFRRPRTQPFGRSPTAAADVSAAQTIAYISRAPRRQLLNSARTMRRSEQRIPPHHRCRGALRVGTSNNEPAGKTFQAADEKDRRPPPNLRHGSQSRTRRDMSMRPRGLATRKRVAGAPLLPDA